MERAYNSSNGLAVHDDPDGTRTLAIAGTRNATDWVTDLAYVFGLERAVPGNRFSAASRAVRVYMPDRVVGHSMGASAAAATELPSVGYAPYVVPGGRAPDSSGAQTQDIVAAVANADERIWVWDLHPHQLHSFRGGRGGKRSLA